MRTCQKPSQFTTAQSKTEQLYAAYNRLMYREAYEILKHPQDSEDAVQQAFLKIAEHADLVDITDAKKARNFAITIVRNSAIDIYRKKKSLPTISLDMLEDTIITYIDGNQLSLCMARLSEMHRKILYLKHSFGYTAREIAHLLSISEASVHKAHQRARKELELICKEQGLL